MQYPKAKAFWAISSIVEHLLPLKQEQVTKRIHLVVVKVKDHLLHMKVLLKESFLCGGLQVFLLAFTGQFASRTLVIFVSVGRGCDTQW